MGRRPLAHAVLAALSGVALLTPVGASQQCDVVLELDSPAAGTVVAAGALVRVAGRAYDRLAARGTGVAHVIVALDDQHWLPADYGEARPDAFLLVWDTTRTPPGPHLLTIYAESACGSTHVQRELTITSRR